MTCDQICRIVSTPRRTKGALTQHELSRVLETLVFQQHRIAQLETEVIILRRELARIAPELPPV